MDCNPPGFSVYGILQARILEWVAIPFSRGSSWPREMTLAGRLYHLSHQESPEDKIQIQLNADWVGVRAGDKLAELTLLVPELLRGHPNSVTHQGTISPLLLGGEWPGHYLDVRKEMVTAGCDLFMVGRAWWSTWSPKQVPRKGKLCHWRNMDRGGLHWEKRLTERQIPYCIASCSKSCLTLCNPMDCSQPASSVHGILQARIPEWFAIPFSRKSFQPRDQTQVSCIAGRFLTVSREALCGV